MFQRTMVALTLLSFLVVATPTWAFDVLPGIDPVEHLPPSIWDFSPQPIDSDFFGPGSDPFDGGIPGDQTSLDPTPDCPDAGGNVSMLIRRLDLAVLPVIPSTDIINTEIVALSLVSSSPIVITYNGGLNPELWDVEITQSLAPPSTGTMTIRRESHDGGTFDAEFLLQPHFTFTRVSDGEVRTLDGAGTYQDAISTSSVPWVYDNPNVACPSCATNFIPGHDGVSKVQYTYSGLLSQHTVQSNCIDAAIPTLSQWALLTVLTMLLVAGAYWVTTRRHTTT